ncbi:MAG TPA: DUF2267 domain-containing protein [Alphaproteobacteria bacterium]|nr:DUF2267 domain-containing protein [Alphaproteobacteria bacterium]
MSATGVEAFDKTLRITNTWLGEIMSEEGPDRQRAWHVLGSVLRTVRDRLPADLGAHLGAQLPLLVRGAYYDRYEPSKLPSRARTLDDFIAPLSDDLGPTLDIDPVEALRTVFQVLSHYLDPGEVRKVRLALPEEVRALWADPAQRH